MKFRTISEAKAELGTLVRMVQGGETVVISRHGRPAVRLISVAEEDFTLSGEDSRKLGAWADHERVAKRTRKYASVDSMLKAARPGKKRSRD